MLRNASTGFVLFAALASYAGCNAQEREFGDLDGGSGGAPSGGGGAPGTGGGGAGSGGLVTGSGGGATSTGGTGSSSGGGSNSGGTEASGGGAGDPNTGGAGGSANGGAGGSTSGGAGGSTNAGGAGGSAPTGGAGGTIGTGGSAAGGASTGGTKATGGSPGTGGALPCGSSPLNACGGCGTLAGTPGNACGACGAWTCNAQKTNVTCVPTAACTFCQKQSAPSGVAATDFACADFDKGLPPTADWTRTTQSQGALSTTSAVAYSAPNSLTTTVAAETDFNNPDAAYLTWDTTGAQPVKSVTVSAALNPTSIGGVVPPGSGYVDFLCVVSGPDRFCLSYTNKGGPLDNYTGYFIRYLYARGAAFSDGCAVNNIPNSVWSQAEFTVATGSITLKINGTTTGTCAAGLATDTIAAVAVGPRTYVETTSTFSMRYDDVVIAVRR